MKKKLFLSLLLLLIGVSSCGLNAMRRSDLAQQQEEDQEQTWFIEYRGQQFLIAEQHLRRIKGLWEEKKLLEAIEGEENRGTLTIDNYFEDMDVTPNDIRIFINLTTQQQTADTLDEDQLHTQIRIADKLNNQFVLNICAQELINQLQNTYDYETSQRVQRMIKDLPENVFNSCITPLLAKKYLPKRAAPYNSELPLTFGQLVFYLALEHQYATSHEAVVIGQEEEMQVWEIPLTPPENIQRKIKELGWVQTDEEEEEGE